MLLHHDKKLLLDALPGIETTTQKHNSDVGSAMPFPGFISNARIVYISTKRRSIYCIAAVALGDLMGVWPHDGSALHLCCIYLIFINVYINGA